MYLVSIIIPVYNCEKYLSETIDSVIYQTYTNWELIIIDDCSTDKSSYIINKYNNPKIRYIKLEQNSGAAIARNKGVEEAKGVYIAFLDGDDLWHKFKLEKQINFMVKNNYLFSSTIYQRIDENSSIINWVSKHFKKRDYNLLLRRCPGNSTVIYNCKILGKTYIPNIRKRNDYVMWLSIIKRSVYIYEMNEVLSYYRIRDDSLSNNKMRLIKYQWNVYRKIEKLSLCNSLYLLGLHSFRGILKIK